jgi:hypothetical protein
VATNTQCLTDTFTVSNQVNLPQICGTMTGEHVFVDASEACNSLDFTIGDNAIDIAAIATRSVSMKVTNIIWGLIMWLLKKKAFSNEINPNLSFF